jgi:hypothetical protein
MSQKQIGAVSQLGIFIFLSKNLEHMHKCIYKKIVSECHFVFSVRSHFVKKSVQSAF